MTSSVRSTTWILLAIVALIACVGLWFARHQRSTRTDAPTPIASEKEREAITLDELDASAASRAVAAEPAGSRTAAAPTNVAGGHVEGRVLDSTGNPVAGVGVTIEAEDASRAPKLAVSGPDGTFGFDTKQDQLRLLATSAEWLTLRSQVWLAADPVPGIIV